MALKNTYAKKGAGYYIQLAQDALMHAGASGIQLEFEDGRVVGLSFSIKFGPKQIQFRLPVNWRKFQSVLAMEGIGRADEDEYAYKVAWACTKDWIEAQMAFVESENVSITQVFLPYAVVEGGITVFEKVAQTDGAFLLGDGK